MSNNCIKVLNSGSLAYGGIYYGFQFFLIDCSGGDIILDLPPAVTGLNYIFSRIDDSTNTLTIQPNGTDTINNAANLLFLPRCLSIVQCYETNWCIPLLQCIAPATEEILSNKKAVFVETAKKNYNRRRGKKNFKK